MIKAKNLILGAGPAGIAAGIRLGKDAIVLDKASSVGGFSSSIEINGAIFDFGGHSFHTPHEDVKDLVFNALEMYEQKRNAKCYSYGQVIDYPFQKSFTELNDKNVVEECLKGLEETIPGKDFPNFEEFIKAKFGPGIAKHFMLPYNKKLWGRDLSRMASDWTAERVAAPKGVDEKFDTQGGKRKPLQADTSVAYPAKGGFGEIFIALGKQLKDVHFNKMVSSVDLDKKIVYTTGGDEYSYENLVSTLPITEFLKMLKNRPENLIDIASRLDNLSMKLGLVVINHSIDTDIQRFYSAEKHICAHKIALNHNSSDYLRTLPTHGVMMEISEGPEKILHRKDTEQWIIDNLTELKVIKGRQDVSHIEVRDVKYSYPVPTHDKFDIMQQIKDWLLENDTYTIGRFGEWDYINSDKALKRGLELGEKLAGI